MTITSVIKDGGRLVIVEDGITKTRSIVYDDAVCSLPPTGYTEVGVIYVDEDNSKLVIQYNGTTAEIELDAAGDLTGAEIIALLEALEIGSRLSHSKLDDVGASDHHAKTTSIADLTDHNKAVHDALDIDADTVDGSHAAAFEVAGAVTAHEGEDDPHTQYQKESEKGAASGYASLSDGSKVVEQPASITDHLDGSPDEDDANKAPTSEWAFDHKADASAHHAKYLDSEAKAAAVQAGAITDGVTKAPTHDAVFDVKATADAALPAVDRYDDAEAVAAMGVKADDNPLNHDQAEEWGATEHSAIGDNAPHHAKYTDAEAVAAAKTVKLDDFAAPDDTTDLDFSTSLHGLVPKGVNLGKFLKDDGTWGTPAGGGNGATKEFFAPATYGTRMRQRANFAGAEINDVDEDGFCTFRIPNDFSSVVTAELIVVPMATQAAANWDIYSSYAGDGENYNLHNESDTTTTYDATLSVQRSIDISGILSSIVVDDLVGIRLVQKTAGHDVFVFGVRFKYS